VHLTHPSAPEHASKTELVSDADTEVLRCLKRLQLIKLTKLILDHCTQAQTPDELAQAKNAGLESIIDIPDQISAKLNSLDAALQESMRECTDIQDSDAEDVIKKVSLVAAPTGLETSVVLTLTVLVVTFLAYVTAKIKVLSGSPESYWGFLTAGISLLLSLHAAIVNPIKFLRFKK
jgi:hypothetical protein